MSDLTTASRPPIASGSWVEVDGRLVAAAEALFALHDLHGLGGPVLAALALGPTLYLTLVRILERRGTPKRKAVPAAA